MTDHQTAVDQGFRVSFDSFEPTALVWAQLWQQNQDAWDLRFEIAGRVNRISVFRRGILRATYLISPAVGGRVKICKSNASDVTGVYTSLQDALLDIGQN